MLDSESINSLKRLKCEYPAVSITSVPVEIICVVLPSVMVYDASALRALINHSYPKAAIFFKNASGKAFGPECPVKIDLLIDLTGPKTKQPLWLPWRLSKMSRYTVGRKVGFFRKMKYHVLVAASKETLDWFDQERFEQQHVLIKAGVKIRVQGSPPADFSKTLPLTLPPDC
jgi:hypothetical protein